MNSIIPLAKAIKSLGRTSTGNDIDGKIKENILSTTIQVIGDSTGNATDEWVYLFATKLANKYTTHNVKYLLYDQPNSRYDVPVSIQNTGVERHILVTANKVHYLPSDAFTITSGDLDVTIRCALDDWQQSSGSPFLACKIGAPNSAWAIRLISSKIYLAWYSDGTNQAGLINTGIDTAGWVDGSEKFIRVKLDVDNGAGGHTVTGYTSTDGVTWSGQTPVVTAGTTSIHADNSSSNKYAIGGSYTSNVAPGKYYELIIRDGIDGAIVNPQPIDNMSANSDTTSVLAGKPNIIIYNASIPGYSVTNFNESLINLCVPSQIGSVVFSSLNHNESTKKNAAYITELNAYIALIKARITAPNIVVLTQNPKIAPATLINDQSIRRTLLMNWAKSVGLNYIDIYKSFLDDSRGLSALINNSDGVHPLAPGSEVWASKVFDDMFL